MTDPVLLLGDRRLRASCAGVGAVRDRRTLDDFARLRRALDEFRAERGFGRGIAAPQIGVARRFVAVSILGEGIRCLVDPRITWRSGSTFTMWDDCMSFPDLLVRLERSESISIAYADEEGRERSLERLGQAESELLQHELDHLDGILAIDRALDRESVVYRGAFASDPGYFRSLVDYAIGR